MTNRRPIRVQKAMTTPRVNVQVTPDIINVAARRDSGHCMIADALRLAVPEAQSVSVDLATIRWTDNANYVSVTRTSRRVPHSWPCWISTRAGGVNRSRSNYERGQATVANRWKENQNDDDSGA